LRDFEECSVLGVRVCLQGVSRKFWEIARNADIGLLQSRQRFLEEAGGRVE